MYISDALIQRFQSLYREKFHKEITAEEAQKQGLAIVRLIIAKERMKERNNEQCQHTIGDVYSRIAGDSVADN